MADVQNTPDPEYIAKFPQKIQTYIQQLKNALASAEESRDFWASQSSATPPTEMSNIRVERGFGHNAEHLYIQNDAKIRFMGDRTEYEVTFDSKTRVLNVSSWGTLGIHPDASNRLRIK